jgi:tetratricopeptide (TPR) repeat protein
MKTRYSTYILLAFLFFVGPLIAADEKDDTTFAKALEKQENKAFSAAIKDYESLLTTEQTSAAVYNNLGLAYASENQVGKAILSFERALRIEPDNKDMQNNLLAAQQRIQENIPGQPSLGILAFWKNLYQTFSANVWAVLVLLLTFGVAYCLYENMLNQKKSFLRPLLLLIPLVLFSLVLGLQRKAAEQNQDQAIVIKRQIGLRKLPDLASDEIELITEGVKIQIIEQRESWVKISLPNSLIGWIPLSMVERI